MHLAATTKIDVHGLGKGLQALAHKAIADSASSIRTIDPIHNQCH